MKTDMRSKFHGNFQIVLHKLLLILIYCQNREYFMIYLFFQMKLNHKLMTVYA